MWLEFDFASAKSPMTNVPVAVCQHTCYVFICSDFNSCADVKKSYLNETYRVDNSVLKKSCANPIFLPQLKNA